MNNTYVENKRFFRYVEKKDLSSELNNSTIWKVGNEFTIDQNYEAYGLQIFNSDSDLSRLLNKKVTEYILNNNCEYVLDSTKYLLNKEEINSFINAYQNEGYFYSNLELITKEMFFEVYRQLYCNNLNGRCNSLFITDEKGIDYWRKYFYNHDLYEIEVSGTYFKSYDYLIPKLHNPFIINKFVKDYYNANQKLDREDNEYLFKGNVKVLRKVN